MSGGIAAYRLTLPNRGLDVTVGALNPWAWMGLGIPHWEGPVREAGIRGV